MFKKIIAYLLVIALVVVPLAGCGGNQDEVAGEKVPLEQISAVAAPELTGLNKMPEDGIGKPGVDFVEIETGSADDWGDLAIPYFNPLGSYSLYSIVEQVENSEELLLHTLEGLTPKTQAVRGEVWNMSIPLESEISILWLRWYANKLGATRYGSTAEHSVFSVKENDHTTWWVDAQISEEAADLHVVKISTLPLGKEMTISREQINKAEEGEYYFYTECTPGQLQSATISLKGDANSGVEFRVEQAVNYGSYQYNVSKVISSDELNTKKGNKFVFDDLPLAEGMLCYKFTASSEQLPEEITVCIDNVAEIEKVKWGEASGAIRVTGIPLGMAGVQQPNWATITHSALGENNAFSVTEQNGTMLFNVPAGYYNVSFPSGLGDELSFLRLVPVSAGEVTTVTIPQEMEYAVGAMSRKYGDFDLNEGGIEILTNKDNGATASVSLVLNDPLDRDISLNKEDVAITENGVDAVITNITREPAGSDVVLVLDSSGSMGENMQPCIEAAKRFVSGLPENSNIRLIQFAQKITEHQGAGKAAVLKSLATIKAGGATSLYDATSRAMGLLKGKKRGYAVVFSDGADSREPGVDGTGSALTKDKLLGQIKASGVTILTIGFGKGHDPATLVQMAKSSANGAYFAAGDKNALDGVFASVAGKLGNQFTIDYQRPTVTADESSAVPVVSLMIDRSGSMDDDPAEDPDSDVGWRLDGVKAIFHDFILGLPKGTLMQVGSFAEPLGGAEPCYDQITTDKQAPALQAIGSLVAGGGTPTITALQLAQQNLSTVPSSKRVLVFFTDAAISGGDEIEKQLIDEVLAELKNSGIRVLIAGLLNTTNAAAYEAAFQAAAQVAGGDYIVTNNVEDIAAKLADLLKRIDEPTPKDGIDFTIQIDCSTADGSRLNLHSGINLENFSPLKSKLGETLKPGMVTMATGEKLVNYDRQAAQLLYGSDLPNVDSRVLFRVPLKDKTAANNFGSLTVSEAYVLDLFKGITPPSGKCFLALNTELTFKAANSADPEKGYRIPNIFNHFYVSYNEGQMMPASEATWLAETPFALPGDPEVTVMKGEKRSGMLVFLADMGTGENVGELSLHMYDTVNGHIQLSLTGGRARNLVNLDSLPTTAANKISEAFSLAITGKKDLTTLEGVSIAQAESDDTSANKQKDVSFRVLEARFDSHVQALLDIDPQKRLLHQLETDQGVLLTEMSNIVYNLPLGFTGKTMLAPGSCNNVRLPFFVPQELLKVKSSIFGDLQEGSLTIPVTEGSPYVTGSIGKTFAHEYFNLKINSLSRLEPDSNHLVLDFTIEDKKDGAGTGGLAGVLQLQRSSEITKPLPGEVRELNAEELKRIAGARKGLGNFADDSEENEGIVAVNVEQTAMLLYGAYNAVGNWGAFDGQKRRGLLVFTLPYESAPADWTLTSTALRDLEVPVSESVYPYQALLAKTPEIPINSEFENILNEAVTTAVTKYHSTRLEPNLTARVGLSDAEILGEQVPAPSLTLYGSQLLQSVRTDEDFLSVMNGQKCVPSTDIAHYYYAPEAVLTQGWGSQYDLAILAHTMLSRLGYRPQHSQVKLTTVGKENLQRLGAVEEIPTWLPAVSYTDAKGELRIYVPVFSRDISELYGLCEISSDVDLGEISPAKSKIIIEMTGKLVGSAGMAATQGMFGDFAAALGGGENGSDFYETVTVFEREVSLPDMSLDPIDISYIATAKSEGGELILPVLDTKQGLLFDEAGWVDSSNYEFESISIKLGTDINDQVVHTTILGKDQKITEVCHTLAWGIPEMSSEAAQPYEKMVEAEAKAAKDPTNYSIGRWLGHATISRFVKNFTDFGRETAKKLEVTAGRITAPIALIVTMKSDTKKAEAVVDLMNHRNQLHRGEEEKQWAYNLMCGYFASEAEASALPNSEGISYLDVWNGLPKDASMYIMAPTEAGQYEASAQELSENGYPPLLVKRLTAKIEDGAMEGTLYIIPDYPVAIDGKPRWAWLEINQTTYDVVSVFESGERAGMADYLIGLFPENIMEVGVGVITGVTTAMWGVSTFALVLDDYKEIRANAAKLCGIIGERMKTISDATGTIGHINRAGQAFGELYIPGKDIGDALSKLLQSCEAQEIQPSFGLGYKKAVEAYFGVD